MSVTHQRATDSPDDLDASPLLDLPGAAAYLADTERHLRGMVQARQIPFVKIGGKLRFLRTDLDDFINSSRVLASR